MFMRMFFTFCILMTGFDSFAAPKKSCEDPGRDTVLCYRMRHMFSIINLFDSQRDLMQTNYELLFTLGTDLNQVVSKILVTNSTSPHLVDLDKVKAMSEDLITYAQKNDIQAVRTANAVKAKCLNCHGGVEPKSHYKWEDLSSDGWTKLVPECNAEGKNPYICKSMFALKADLSLVNAVKNSGIVHFKTIEVVADELARVAVEVGSRMASHGDEFPLSELDRRAKELAQAAREHSPQVFSKALMIHQSCMQCHDSGNTKPQMY